MRISRNQTGSSHLVLILAVAVIAAVGLVGYRISQSETTQLAGNAPVPASTKTPSSEFKSSADVQKASQALDATAIDGDVNPNKLDEDLNAVL